jgi:uncharacterized protein YjdB
MIKKNSLMRNAGGSAAALTVALLGVLLLLWGCDNGTGTTVVPVTGVSINPAAPQVAKDGTVQLNAVVSPADATDKTLTWTSSNTAFVTVNASSGLVTGIDIGTAEITAASPDGPSDTVTVTVVQGSTVVAVTGVSISPVAPQVAKGATVQLQAEISPSNATDKTLTWSSADTAVATVNASSGLVTGVDIGTAEITAASPDGPSDTVTVTVNYAPVTGVTLKDQGEGAGTNETYLTVGKTLQLSAPVSPAGANPGITWKSSDQTVATVSNAGLVTTVKIGVAGITATSTADSTKSATYKVNVTAPVDLTGISLAPDPLDLARGEDGTITVTFTPVNTTQRTITWTSAAPAVATVSGGTVHAVSKGSSVITATGKKIDNSDVTDMVTVNVTVPVTGVTLNRTTLVMVKGVTAPVTLTAAVSPADADNTTITWSSSNSAVATVSAGSGASVTVTAVSFGTTVITAESAADSTKKAECAVTVSAQGINVVFVGFDDEVRDLTGPESALSISNGDELTVTAPAGYSNYQWLVDGGSFGNGYGPVFNLPVAQLPSMWGPGNHTLTLIVTTAEGSPFSKSLQFTVTY